MGDVLNILLMINNYSHDMATALLLASGCMMWITTRAFTGEMDGSPAGRLFLLLNRKTALLAKISLIWIVVAGVPRFVFYRTFEWSTMVGELQVVTIIIKHIVMFLLLGTGVYYWHKVRGKMKSIAQETKELQAPQS